MTTDLFNTLDLKDENEENVIYSKYQVLTLLQNYSEFYTSNNFFANWSNWRSFKWREYLRAYKALQSNYNPIENYNRVEVTGNGLHKGSETITRTNNGTMSTNVAQNEKSTDSVSTYDNTLKELNQTVIEPTNNETYSYKTDVNYDNFGYTDTHTFEGTDDVKLVVDGKEITFVGGNTNEINGVVSNISGNIGVTTSQQMIESEIELRKKNILEIYVKEFADRYIFYGGGTIEFDIV